LKFTPLIKETDPVQPLEFDIPAQADGGRRVAAFGGSGGQALGGNGRGAQVAELWLIKK
jgi:hypothetical protein